MIASSTIPFNPQMSTGGPMIAALLAKLGAPGAQPNVMAPGGGIGGGIPALSLAPATQPMAPAPMDAQQMPMSATPSMAPPIADAAPFAQAPADIAAPGPVTPLETPMPHMQGHGFFQRVGDALRSPGMAAALFRSGAATINGGLGAGLEAGANYMDQRKATEVHTAQQAFENALASGRLDLDKLTAKQKDDLARAGINVDIARLGENIRHNKVGEKVELRGQDVQLHGIDTAAATTRRGQDVSVHNNDTDNATAQRGQDKTYDANIYGSNVGLATAGIGSRGNTGGYSETETVSGTPGGFFSSGTPDKTKTITRVPLAAGASPFSPTAAPAVQPMAPPKLGDVVLGKQYLGGDPRNPKSWR